MKLKIGFPIKFNKSKFPSKKKLIGKYCVLEPVNVRKHSKDFLKNFSLDNKASFGFICHQVHLKMKLLLKNI